MLSVNMERQDVSVVSSQDRLRSGRACLGCRKRKNRCNGERPTCAFCQKRNLVCQYGSITRKGIASQTYVRSLEEKIRQLENGLQKLSAPNHASDGGVARPGRQEDSSRDLQEDSSDPSEGQFVDEEEEETRLEDTSMDVLEYNQSSIDSTVVNVGIPPANGSSDPMIASAANEASPFPKQARSGSVIRASSELDSENFILPPQELARELVDHFFKYTYLLYPVLHEPTFRKSFDDAYAAAWQPTVPWLATLNLVLAFGCDYLDLPLHESFRLAQTFHRRGADLILSVCFDQSTVETVQALLLLTVHLQSDLKMNRCWMSIGCLVRTAQGLRMNTDPSGWNLNIVDREIRKRLWWGVYSLDRFISQRQGQSPTLLSESTPGAGIPLTSSDGLTEEEINAWPELRQSPSPICFFNAMVQLSHLSETISSPSPINMGLNSERYIPQPNGSFNLDEAQMGLLIAQVNEQEARLTAWKDNLPPHLCSLRREGDQAIMRQCLMLHLRYLQIRLLIHRQVFSLIVRQGDKKINLPQQGYLRSVIMASVEQCADCARETVLVIIENQDPRLIGPWWYNVQHMVTALTTLLAIHASAKRFPMVNMDFVSAAIGNAVGTLSRLSQVNDLMARSSKHFEKLRRRIAMATGSAGATVAQSPTPAATNHEQQNGQEAQEPGEPPTLSNDSNTPDTDFAGSLNEDWTRLFLEPILPDFGDDIFNI